MKFKLIMFLLCLSPIIVTDEGKEFDTIKILVYNTHGLPEIFIDDNPKFRFPIIGSKTKAYDISLIQEDYAHHEELESGLDEKSIAIRGPLGNTLFCPFCTGSGLTTIFSQEEDWDYQIESEAFETCSGWLRGANDCFAYKGFQLIKLIIDGNELYILNTHMDAGRRDSDRASRKLQLDHIYKVLEQKTKGNPLIVAGDLNLSAKDPEDMKLLSNFKEKLNLVDSFEGVNRGLEWSILDYILYRGSSTKQINIIDAGEDRSFVTEEGYLSDHPALFVEISF